MNFKDDFLSRESILKIFLILISILLWMYFYVSSKVSLKLLIVFDLPSIINTFFTTNFVLFLLFFPITTCIIIALSKGKNKLLDQLQVSVGIIFGFVFGIILFGKGYSFLLFGLFYLVSHIILVVLTYYKFKEKGKDEKKLFTVSNYATSKISLILTISLFIVIIILVYPHQKDSAHAMEAGVVNLFVGDDISKWLGTSYSISKISTKSAVDYIISSPEYRALETSTDAKAENFTNFINDLSIQLSKPTTEKDISQAYGNLNNIKLKNQILDTIQALPLMIIIEEYFAIVFAVLIVSIAQLYFTIAFSLLGLLYIFIFYKLFVNESNYSENNELISEEECEKR